MLDLDRIRDAPLAQEPYPYFVVADAISGDSARQVAEDFPEVERPGAIDISQVRYGASFERLINELKSDRFRRLIEVKFDLDLGGKEIVVNVRGQMRVTDGNIHTDTPAKLVTILLYFNEPGALDETGLRILRNGHDLDDFAELIPPHLGTLVAFKVTPDCWHGHRAIEGRRLSLQMNYLSGVKTRGKHQLAHRLLGRMKRKVGRALGRSN